MQALWRRSFFIGREFKRQRQRFSRSEHLKYRIENENHSTMQIEDNCQWISLAGVAFERQMKRKAAFVKLLIDCFFNCFAKGTNRNLFCQVEALVPGIVSLSFYGSLWNCVGAPDNVCARFNLFVSNYLLCKLPEYTGAVWCDWLVLCMPVESLRKNYSAS